MSSIGDTRSITIATRATNANINFTIISIGTIVASVNSVDTIRDSRSITKIANRSTIRSTNRSTNRSTINDINDINDNRIVN